MAKTVSESRFYMWRAIFAVAHVDNVVTDDERTLLNKILLENPFTESQIETLKQDIEYPQDIVDMFRRITDQPDRSQFFDYARKLVWVDGDYGKQEQEIILKLKRAHVQMTDFENLSGGHSFQLEDDRMPAYMGGIRKTQSGSLLDVIRRWLTGR